VPLHITSDGWAGRKSFPEWQVWSGQDADSKDNWFTLLPGDPPLSRVFTNPTTTSVEVSLQPRNYLDLDQNPVTGAITLPPFASQVLIDNGLAEDIFADNFETGNLSKWSSTNP
jgi:hypothetical protein